MDKGYWRDLINGRISRRDLMAATGATAAGAAFLAACGDDDEGDVASTGGDSEGTTGSTGAGSASTGTTGSTGSDSASSSEGGEPVLDRVVLSLEYTGAETNDTRDPSGSESWPLEPIYESLLSHDRETGEIIPSLATDWEFSDDGASIRFTLREGIQFHDDWGEMTADDVVFTYEYQGSDPTKSQSVPGFVDSVEKTGDYEVVVHLTQPDANAMEWVITDQYIWSSIVSKAHWESVGDGDGINKPPLAGTGPWQLLEREPGNFIRYKRVEDHWRVTPQFKELEIRLISEPSTRLASLLAEEVHITLLPKDLQQTAADRGMLTVPTLVPSLRVFLEYWGCCVMDLDGNIRHPESPLMDLRVRKAMNKAIDRAALNAAFLDNTGELMILNHFHPTRPGWDPSWEERFEEEYGYDPDAARELLAEAGYGLDNPVRTNMLFTYEKEAAGGEDLQETVVSYWRDIGVECEMHTIDRATARPAAENFEYDNMMQMTTTSSNLTVGLRVYQVNNLRSTDDTYVGSFRGTHVEGLDQMYDAMLSETNPERFSTMAREVGEILFVNHANIPLFWMPGEWTLNPNVVAGWGMPGMYGGFLSHTENIEAVTT